MPHFHVLHTAEDPPQAPLATDGAGKEQGVPHRLQAGGRIDVNLYLVREIGGFAVEPELVGLDAHQSHHQEQARQQGKDE